MTMLLADHSGHEILDEIVHDYLMKAAINRRTRGHRHHRDGHHLEKSRHQT